MDSVSSGSLRLRLVCAALSIALVALPFACVTFPPVTDLPQHLAQIRLFFETLARPDGPYRIQWLTPYSLVFVLFGLAWKLASPANVGRLVVLALGISWAGATHALAARRGRPPEAAMLASMLVFCHVLYWGFCSFAIGWPAFVLWLCVTTRSPAEHPFGKKQAATLLGSALLLFFSHALWFAAGMVWLLVFCLWRGVPRRQIALRFASLSPLGLAVAALWVPRFYGVQTALRPWASDLLFHPIWKFLPTARLSFSWLVDSAFGGLRGSLEYILFGTLLGWILAGSWQHRDQPEAFDRSLLAASGQLWLMALVLPYKYMDTVLLGDRWVPAAMTLLVLAVPAPKLAPRLRRLGAGALLATACTSTAFAWMIFEQNDLSGLRSALAALSGPVRVLGLDYVKVSPTVKGRPFIQDFAYAQAFAGSSLNFSFAEFPPSLVVFKERPRKQWTEGLEWSADVALASDFSPFDCALINAYPETHEQLARRFPITPLTHEGNWRLYRVSPLARLPARAQEESGP